MKKTVITVAATLVVALLLRNYIARIPGVNKIPALGSAPSAS